MISQNAKSLLRGLKSFFSEPGTYILPLSGHVVRCLSVACCLFIDYRQRLIESFSFKLSLSLLHLCKSFDFELQ